VMEYVLLGLSLGLASGLSPGPLLTYTVVATLRGGWKAGVGVGSAPLLTDAPIIALVLLVLRLLPPAALDWLSIFGGIFLGYLGFETIRSARHAPEVGREPDVNVRQELGRGVLVNFLNPNPYLFWGTVGGPLLIRAYHTHPLDAVAFLVLFYALLVGSHVGLALLVHHQRDVLQGAWYRRVLWLLGAILILFGVRFIGAGMHFPR